MTTPVTKSWLDERGGLHDARVRLEADANRNFRVWVDDEWANEDSELGPARPGALVFHDASNELEMPKSGEGWISEVWIDDLGRFVLDFCDRDQLIISAAKTVWVPSGGH